MDVLSSLHHFLTQDVPELLTLCEQAVRTAHSRAHSLTHSLEQWVFFLPVATGVILVIVSVLYTMMYLVMWRTKRGTKDGVSEGVSEGVSSEQVKPRSWYLTRLVLLRGMGVLYTTAFLTSALQSRALFGTQGLAPAPGMVASQAGTLHAHTRPVPAFTLLAPWCSGDLALELISWIGLLLSLLLIVLPCSSRGVWGGLPLLLWGLYLSIVNLGGMIMNYGWEWETLEVGFIMIFLCPLIPSWFRNNNGRGINAFAPSTAVLWLLRWGTFRLMIGAGMSKIGLNSSDCWLDLTCTETHYETQPMPNALAWAFHKLPSFVHKGEVAMTFFEQLILPWFALFPPVYENSVFPRQLRQFCFICECFFQICIVGTGNYAWINFVGVVPCFAMLDDQFLCLSPLTKWLFSEQDLQEAEVANQAENINQTEPEEDDTANISENCVSKRPFSFYSDISNNICRKMGVVLRMCLVMFILVKSVAPVKELFTPAPWLHYYDDYFFVNAQGVFGFINQHRVVLVLETSYASLDQLVEQTTSQNTRRCIDHVGPVARDANGGPITCAQLEDYCSQAGVPDVCPDTCGKCPQNINLAARLAPPAPSSLDSSSVDVDASNPWTGTLEFKNLPGCVNRAPKVNSPYHYRFDWEVWIRTTASMERQIHFDALQRVRALGTADVTRTQQLLPDMPVPAIVKRMVDGILRGDTDAMGLLANDRDDLLRCERSEDDGAVVFCHPPTAVRARYYLYTYSSPSELAVNGTWWSREAISKPSVLLGKRGMKDGENKLRRSPWQRHWIMLIAVCGVVSIVQTAPFYRRCTNYSMKTFIFRVVVLLSFLVSFVFALTADYEAVLLVPVFKSSYRFYRAVMHLATTVIAVGSIHVGYHITGALNIDKRRVFTDGLLLNSILNVLLFGFVFYLAHGANKDDTLLSSWKFPA
jgi:hypothetical protein